MRMQPCEMNEMVAAEKYRYKEFQTYKQEASE